MPVRQQDVLRLDVAMDDAAAVRVAQGVGYFAGDGEGVIERELLLAVEPVAERLPLDVGHDIVEEAVGLAGVKQRQNVWMLQVGRCP